MIELDIKTYRKKLEAPQEVTGGFKAPMIFYLSHKDDEEIFLITFVIIDFPRQEIVYIVSRSSLNQQKLSNHPDKKLFFKRPYANPHCSLSINSGEDLYTFMEGANYFFYVNYKKNIMRIFLADELLGLEPGKIRETGATFYKDDTDSNKFYFVAEEKNEKQEGRLHFSKVNLDMSQVQDFFQTSYSTYSLVPHVSRKVGQYLLNSEFSSTRYQNLKTGKIFSNWSELSLFVYQDLYRNFCRESGRTYSLENFKSENRINGFKDNLNPQFEIFCKKRGDNLMEICRKGKDYSFSVLPGKISTLDLDNLNMKSYETTFCAPGHFEVDEKTKTIYTSSHNFIRAETNYFLGPAAFDKFFLNDGELVKTGVFTDPTGYRFTSHRIFYHKGHPYIATIGQPNRLFFIDAEKMKTYYTYDLFEDVLSDKDDIASFLNNVGHVFEGRLIYMALEVSAEGEYICIIGYNSLAFFSFSQRKIVLTVPFYPKSPLGQDIPWKYFHRKTTHANYLI